MKKAMVCALGLVGAAVAASAATTYDLVIYGSSPAGLAAAVQAKRMGLRAVVVSPEKRIGGLTTGGLGQTDIGNKRCFGGIAREFYCDVAKYYRDPKVWTREKMSDYSPDGQCFGSKGADSMWTFEPSAARKILEGWEKRDGLAIVRGEYLDRESKSGVEVEEGKVKSIKTLSGKVFCGKMFVDATYEGDLMAAAGVSYTVGREGNDVYGETLNGIQRRQGHHKFEPKVSAYVVPDDPKSGLLPNVFADTEDPDGTGDKRVQAYCFRMCLTDVPENRIPFAKPANYNPLDYELLIRNLALQERRHPEWKKSTWRGFPWINSRMPNRKTDTNNRGGFSTDFIGRNWAWPEASYAEREKILKEHLDYQRGLMWTLANDLRVPEHLRKEIARWGTCKDEFPDGLGDGWQDQLYVREGRRMVGDYVMTERNCRGSRTALCPVAMGAYQMDSHHVRRYANKDGYVQNEGDVEVGTKYDGSAFEPYGIEYAAILPKRVECGNLFVPVCLSASHIAFGSIRMEPVFFALGQVAGTAAALAIADGVVAQDVDYAKLAKRLRADGQVLSLAPPRESVVFVEAHPDDLPGHLGTALRLAEKFDVHIIDFTHGELGCGWEKFTNGWTKATRTAEETEVCRRAGFKLHWCDAVDGFSYADEKVCRQLAAYLKEIQPRAVFCHWLVDVHPDHMMSAAAAIKAVGLAGLSPEMYFHEQDIQSRGFRTTFYVDITEQVEKKAELVKLYACQHGEAIAKRKAESNRVYGRNSSQKNVELIGVFPSRVRVGHSVFDGLPGVVY